MFMCDLSSITAIEDSETLNSLTFREEWDYLWSQNEETTPFQSPDWILSWWKHFGNQRPWVIVQRQNAECVGILPLYILQDNQSKNKVLMMGTGISDYLDGTFQKGLEKIVSRKINQFLHLNENRWDHCILEQLPADSVLLNLETFNGVTSHIEIQDFCPVLSLPKTELQRQQFFTSNHYKKIFYYRRRFEKLSPLHFDNVTFDSLPSFMNALFKLHGDSWRLKNEKGVLHDTSIQNFHRDVSYQMLLQGNLRMYALSRDSEIIAIYYGFVKGRRGYYYLSGYNPEFRRFNLGSLIVSHAINQSIREGLEEFDFLRGQESYKYTWGAKDRPNYRLILNKTPNTAAHIPTIVNPSMVKVSLGTI
jgi:CelD/BcsL family acetyltransferase involved in cellulose biosynthesis